MARLGRRRHRRVSLVPQPALPDRRRGGIVPAEPHNKHHLHRPAAPATKQVPAPATPTPIPTLQLKRSAWGSPESAEVYSLPLMLSCLSSCAPVAVSSGTAPAAYDVYPNGSETEIRIGDPDRTSSGRHRCRVQYPAADVASGHLSPHEGVTLYGTAGRPL